MGLINTKPSNAPDEWEQTYTVKDHVQTKTETITIDELHHPPTFE